MKARLDMDRIAKALGAERRGKVHAGGEYFGALQLAAELSHRFRTPENGGRPTDPSLTERRLVGFSPSTLRRLKDLTRELSRKRHVSVQPMQLAALLLERAVAQVNELEAEQLLEKPAGTTSSGSHAAAQRRLAK